MVYADPAKSRLYLARNFLDSDMCVDLINEARHAALYEYCADARSKKEIAARFDDASWIDGALEEFVQGDLMIHLDGLYLSLALPENPNF